MCFFISLLSSIGASHLLCKEASMHSAIFVFLDAKGRQNIIIIFFGNFFNGRSILLGIRTSIIVDRGWRSQDGDLVFSSAEKSTARFAFSNRITYIGSLGSEQPSLMDRLQTFLTSSIINIRVNK